MTPNPQTAFTPSDYSTAPDPSEPDPSEPGAPGNTSEDRYDGVAEHESIIVGQPGTEATQRFPVQPPPDAEREAADSYSSDPDEAAAEALREATCQAAVAESTARTEAAIEDAAQQARFRHGQDEVPVEPILDLPRPADPAEQADAMIGVLDAQNEAAPPTDPGPDAPASASGPGEASDFAAEPEPRRSVAISGRTLAILVGALNLAADDSEDATWAAMQAREVLLTAAHAPDADAPRCWRWGRYGWAAVQVGTPDFALNGSDTEGALTDAGDAIANILHWTDEFASEQGEHVEDVLRRARSNYAAEAGLWGDE